jgi:WD40 repeat protein
MDQRTDSKIPPWINPESLTDFIFQLRAAGYKIGVSQHIAAQELVLALIDRGESLDSPEHLSTLLGPIFCTSPTEQDDFQQQFSGWIKFLRDTQLPANTTDVPTSISSTDTDTSAQPTPFGNIGSRKFKRKLVYTTFAISLLALVFGVLRYYILPPTKKVLPTPTTTGVLPTPTATGVLPTPTTTGVLPTPTTTGVLPTPTTTTPIPKPIASPKVNSLPFFPGWQLVYICALLVPTFALAFFIIWRLWHFKKDPLFLQRLSSPQEPEQQKLSMGGLEHNLFPPILFSHIAKGLKRRMHKPSKELDMKKTIDSTLRNGGFLTPVYEILQVPLEYLILIDRSSFRDHQTQFIKEMIDLLKQDGVFITKYFFEGNPKVCFGEAIGSPPKKLKEIMNQYQQHLLIIASDAHEFFSAINGELEPWVGQIESWQERVILTPNPIGNWVRQEKVLVQKFLVLPATLQGLRILSQILNPDVTKPTVLVEMHRVPLPEQFITQPLRWIDREPPDTDLIEEILQLTKDYLGEAGYYWLSSCAVFPEIHWIITLYLGTQLKMEDSSALAASCSLESLVRLPWFRYGYMPDWLRVLLIENLSDQQKSGVRSALEDFLVSAIRGTESQQQLVLATNQPLFPMEKINPILRYFNRKSSESSLLREYLFLSFMKKQPLLASKVPETIRSLLNEKALYRSYYQSDLSQLATVTYDALFGNWQQLKDWLGGGRSDLRFQRRLDDAVMGWQENGRSEGNLWRSSDLDLLQRYQKRAGDVMTELQLDFFNASINAENAQKKAEKQRVQVVKDLAQANLQTAEYRSKIARGIIGGSLVAVAIISVFAWMDWKQTRQAELNLVDVLSASALALIDKGKDLDAFIPAIRAGKILQSQKVSNPSGLNALQEALNHRSERNRLEGHLSSVWSVSFSPDGQTLATGSEDKTIKLWNLATGKEIRTLRGHQSSVWSVSFSPDGQTLASGSLDNTIKLWNLATGKEIRTLQGHQRYVYSVSFSPDGQTLASGSDDNTIKLWNLATGKEIRTLQGHQRYVWSVSFSPDGQTLASGSADNTIKLWNLSTGKEIRTLQGHQSSVWSVSFSPDGQTLASGSADNTIKLWNLSTSKEIRTLQGHQSSVWSVSFSPNGQTLATGSGDKTIKLWNLATGKEIRTLQGHQNEVLSVSFSPDGQTLASGSADNTIKLWNLSTSKEIRTLQGHQSSVWSVSFSPNGQTLATGSEDKTIKLWNLSTSKEIRILREHQSWVRSVSFSPSGQTLATGGDDKKIKLWNVSTGQEIYTLQGHKESVRSVSFTPDGQTLATGSDDKMIKLWNVSTGQEIRTLQGHQKSVRSVSFSPDGRTLATGSLDETIKLWDVATGKEIRTLQGHQKSVRSVSFSPDGQTLATGSEDKTIKLWNLATGQEIHTLRGHQSSVWSVSFSPDGQTLATGSADKMIKLWNRETGWDLDALMGRSCDWVRPYLESNINISESDRHLCDGIGSKKQ